MTKTKFISWGQLLLLLFMCRVFTLMTFVPFSEEPLSLRLTAAAISSAVQAVILIPVVMLKDSATAVLLRKSKPLGIIAAAFYLIFFLVYAAGSLLHFRSFLATRFFPTADSIVWIAVILVVCVYCGCLGIEALGRSSAAVFWLFIAAIAAMVLSSAGEFSTSNVYLSPVRPTELFTAVMDDLARNGEICAAVFLAKHVRERLRCGVYGLLAAKLIFTASAMLVIALVLGDFALLTDYPFLSLGTFGGARFLQRSDSLYLIVWTITAVINIALFLLISAGLMEECLPKMKFRTSIAASAVFGTALLFSVTGLDFSAVFSVICSGYAVIILAGIIPLAALILKKMNGGTRHEN